MNKAMARMLIVGGATGFFCTTMSLPANASLPGNGFVNLNFAATGNGDAELLDTGVAVDEMTCFLSRVAGDLVAPTSSDGARVDLVQLPVNGVQHWFLDLDSTAGSVQASISCLWNPSIPNFVGVTGTGSYSTTLTGTDSETQCFLQGISVDGPDSSFASSDAKVVVSRSGSGVWSVSVENVGSGVATSIQCMDVPGAAWFMENNWTGNFTVTAFEQTSTAPEVCALRGIEGVFSSSSDTVGVFPPGSLPGHWELETTTNVDRGWITCLQ